MCRAGGGGCRAAARSGRPSRTGRAGRTIPRSAGRARPAAPARRTPRPGRRDRRGGTCRCSRRRAPPRRRPGRPRSRPRRGRGPRRRPHRPRRPGRPRPRRSTTRGGAVVDERAHHDRDVVEIGESGADRRPGAPGDAGDDVAVGGEVRRLDRDHGAVGPPGQGGVDELVEAHRRRVVNDDRTGRGADDGGEPVADTGREVEPLALLPRTDQPVGPLPGGHAGDPVERGPRRHAERVPVQVHEPLRGDEALAPARQLVGGVPGEGVVPGDHDGELRAGRSVRSPLQLTSRLPSIQSGDPPPTDPHPFRRRAARRGGVR